jgi:hypothetical protein
VRGITGPLFGDEDALFWVAALLFAFAIPEDGGVVWEEGIG